MAINIKHIIVIEIHTYIFILKKTLINQLHKKHCSVRRDTIIVSMIFLLTSLQGALMFSPLLICRTTRSTFLLCKARSSGVKPFCSMHKSTVTIF